MKIIVDEKIFEVFDNPRIGITVVSNADNTINLDLDNEFLELAENIITKYENQTISEIPKISSWRQAYRLFGAKPKDYPSSIESLLKRVVKGNLFWGINPLVDIYNFVSLKHILPAGGEDINKINGDLVLTFATEEETPVTVLGRDQEESPKVCEVIYKDLDGTICRRWNWREVERIILTEQTQNCVIVMEALNPVLNEELESAQKELGELLKKYCNATIQHHIITNDNQSIEVNS